MRRKIGKYISMGMTAVMLIGAVPMQTVLGADSSDSGYILEAEGNDGVSARDSVGGDDVPEKSDDANAEKIEVLDDVKAGAESEDVTSSFTDDNFKTAVKEKLGLSENEPITKDACAGVTELDVNGKNIRSLNGIENFTDLLNLRCKDNLLTELNVSSCKSLRWMDCGGNQLTALNVNGCANLETLRCGCNVNGDGVCIGDGNRNQLTALDISSCSNLRQLYCGGNNLTALDVSRCTKLSELDCAANQMKELDLTKCIDLRRVECHGNQIERLNMDNNTQLTYLICSQNQLQGLDVSKCVNLEWLTCSRNQLLTLDVNNCTKLKKLYCNGNVLSEINISNCKNLESFNCDSNVKVIRDSADNLTQTPTPSQVPPEPSIPAVNPNPTPDITPDPTPLPTPNPAAQNFKETCFVKEIVGKEKTFEIPSAGRARLTFEECVNPESYSLGISGCRVSDFQLTNEKEKAYTNWFAVSSGTLKVNLSSSQPVNDEAVAYVEYEAGGSYVGEVESNDSFETANKIAVNTDYWAAGGNNWDYFYFEVDGPSKVEFPETFRTLWNDGSELLLYREDEKNNKELYTQAFGDREEFFLPSMRLTKGKYYLAFYPRYYYTYWTVKSSLN